MKYLRRAHMFAGLFMAPWVLLYGLSGFYFHHRAWFAPDRAASRAVVMLPPAALEQTSLASLRWPTAEALARQVVAAINERDREKGFELGSAAPRLNLTLWLPVRNETVSGNAMIDPIARVGSMKFSPTAEPVTQAFDHLLPPLLDGRQAKLLHEELASIIERADPRVREVGAPQMPVLHFQVRQAGQEWSGQLELATGAVTLQSAVPTTLLNFAGQLHKTYTVPGAESWMKSVWTILADVLALLLCFWATTGILMWFQLKPMRRGGIVALALAALSAILIAAGMWRELVG